jgi:hypothetical protein
MKKLTLMKRVESGAAFRKIDDQSGTGPAVRKALSLGPEASDNDVVAEIEKRKKAIADIKHEISMQPYRKIALAEREARTQTNLAEQNARSYLSKAYQEAFAARQAQFNNSPEVKAELKKLRSSDVGRATLEPETSSGVNSFNVDDPADAVAQLRTLAEEQRKQNPKLSMSQAYDRVYADVKNRELIEQAMSQRSPSQARLLDPKPPF